MSAEGLQSEVHDRYLRPIDDPDWVEVTSFAAVREAFRSPSLVLEIGSEHERVYSKGSLVKISGSDHRLRRKTWNQLLKRDGHKWFRDTALYPTVDHNLDELLAGREGDAPIRFDVVKFGKRTMMQLAAALVGVDRARSAEGADELLELIPRFGMQEAKLAPIFGFDADTVIPRVEQAKREYLEKFHQPALDRRRELVRQVDAGDVDPAELPHDLVTLIAAHGDDAGWSAETGLRDSMLLVLTSSDSSVGTITWTIDELTHWFAAHPEDLPLRTDPEFLLAAVNETLRLHPLSFAFMRRALEDVVLPGGIEVKAGQKVALRNRLANRDTAVFGPTADSFDPRRERPEGVHPYGLSFGAGPHMCFGIPIVMGSEGIDGSLVHILTALYRAGLEPDPESEPTRSGAQHHGDRFLSYPVQFAATP